MLRKTFCHTMKEVTGHWRKCYGASWLLLLTKCYSSGKINEDDMSGICDAHGGKEKCIQSLMRKPEGKITHRRPSSR